MKKTKAFVERARSSGSSYDEVVWLMQSKGWSLRDARRATLDHFEGNAGVAVPAGVRKNESNALDAALYSLSSIVLIVLVVHLLLVTNSLTDRMIDPSKWSPNELIYPMAGLVVTGPLYLVLMIIIARRLKIGATPRNSGPRGFIFGATFVIGCVAIIGYLIAGVYAILSGQELMGAVIKAGLPVVVLAGFASYYYMALRPRKED